MEIVIEAPTFFDTEDENIFFSCIYNLPTYKKVIGKGSILIIELSKKPSEKTLLQLLVICKRWNINRESLYKFKNKNNEGSLLWNSEK